VCGFILYAVIISTSLSVARRQVRIANGLLVPLPLLGRADEESNKSGLVLL
jgi:hypothetical protein